jgi:hypothetical protein
MAFRKGVNRHDAWQRLIRSHRAEIAETGLPNEIFVDEDRFIEFLNTGASEDNGTRLQDLTDDEFLRLEKAVKCLVDSLFFAFDRERLKRFNRYG